MLDYNANQQQTDEYLQLKQLDPFKKYQRRNIFPKRFIIHIFLIIFTTLQVTYYGSYLKDYRRYNISLWESLLLHIQGDDQQTQHYYTVNQLNTQLHEMIDFFKDINNMVLFEVFNMQLTSFYLYSYFEDLNAEDIQKDLKVQVDIQEGFKKPFDYNNPEDIKKYTISVSRFAFSIYNLETRFPYMGNICWNIEVVYDIENDFMIIAKTDALQVRCQSSILYDSFENQEQENKNNNNNQQFNDSEDTQEKQEKQDYFFGLSRMEQNRRFNQYLEFQNQSPKNKIKNHAEYQKQKNSFKSNISGSSNKEKFHYIYGFNELLVINIFVIFSGLLLFSLNLNHLYKGLRNYIGIKLVRKLKVINSLKKVKLFNKINQLRKLTVVKIQKQQEKVQKDVPLMQEIELQNITDKEKKLENKLKKKQATIDKIEEQYKQQKQNQKNHHSMHHKYITEKQQFEQNQTRMKKQSKNKQKFQAGKIEFESQKRTFYDFFDFWHIFTMIGNCIQILSSFSLCLDLERSNLNQNSTHFNFLGEITIGFSCMFAWIGLSEYLEQVSYKKYNMFSILMKHLSKTWIYNIITVLPVFMAFVVIGSVMYWESEYFYSLKSTAITLFSIYHGDMLSDFMYSILEVSNSPLQLVYCILYTLLFAMFVNNMFASVIFEIREQLISNLKQEQERKRQLQIKLFKEKILFRQEQKQLRKQQKQIYKQEEQQNHISELKLQESFILQENERKHFDLLSDQIQLAQKQANVKLPSIISLNDDSKIIGQQQQKYKQTQKKQVNFQIQQQQTQEYQEEEEEDRTYSQISENLKIKQLTIHALLKEFIQIKDLMISLELSENDKFEFYQQIIETQQYLKQSIERQLQEVAFWVQQQEIILKNQDEKFNIE